MRTFHTSGQKTKSNKIGNSIYLLQRTFLAFGFGVSYFPPFYRHIVYKTGHCHWDRKKKKNVAFWQSYKGSFLLWEGAKLLKNPDSGVSGQCEGVTLPMAGCPLPLPTPLPLPHSWLPWALDSPSLPHCPSPWEPVPPEPHTRQPQEIPHSLHCHSLPSSPDPLTFWATERKTAICPALGPLSSWLPGPATAGFPRIF